MKRRWIPFALALSVMISCLVPVCATAADREPKDERSVIAMSLHASNSFDTRVPANTFAKADTQFSLAIGDTVTINATYSPASADVDIGLISPDGLFHPFPASDGRFEKTIEVSSRGKYSHVTLDGGLVGSSTQFVLN